MSATKRERSIELAIKIAKEKKKAIPKGGDIIFNFFLQSGIQTDCKSTFTEIGKISVLIGPRRKNTLLSYSSP